jgi:hypothetical protein
VDEKARERGERPCAPAQGCGAKWEEAWHAGKGRGAAISANGGRLG